MLLDYLRRFATRPERARSHATIADALNLGIRSIVDLADELLRAGHVVVARVTSPFGCWLLDPAKATVAEWEEARAYRGSLNDRGVKILARRQHVDSALRRAEAERPAPVPAGGQARLF